MGASFTITFDATPPVAPALVIESGVNIVSVQYVLAAIASSSSDADQMKFWGDVDPDSDSRVGLLEVESDWIDYSEAGVFITLSAGAGRKHLYARVRDDVGNASPVVSSWVDLVLDLPVVSIVEGVDVARVSLISGFDTATFGWQASDAFNRYEVRLVPNPGSPRTAGNPLNTADGTFPADTTIHTVVTGADIQDASVGDGTKIVKVFVRRSDGTWSI